MKALCIIIPLIAAVPALAQDRNPTSTKDVTAQPISPAPDNGDIIVGFGASTRIYFKRPIKAIRIEDELAVRAVPESDHIVTFTGLAPGRSTLNIETTDGRTDSWGMVTVVRDLHEVRIYTAKPINRVTGEYRQGNPVDAAGYLPMQCNEVTCNP